MGSEREPLQPGGFLKTCRKILEFLVGLSAHAGAQARTPRSMEQDEHGADGALYRDWSWRELHGQR